MKVLLAALIACTCVCILQTGSVAAQSDCTLQLRYMQTQPSDCRGNYVLRIKPWFGRLGNNLISLANAIHLARETNSEVLASAHPLLRQTEWDFREKYEKDKEWNITIQGAGSLGRQLMFTDDFYHEDEMPLRLTDWSFGSTKQREVLVNDVLPALRIIPSHVRNAVVVHVRSGDVFTSATIHPYYGEALCT